MGPPLSPLSPVQTNCLDRGDLLQRWVHFEQEEAKETESNPSAPLVISCSMSSVFGRSTASGFLASFHPRILLYSI